MAFSPRRCVAVFRLARRIAFDVFVVVIIVAFVNIDYSPHNFLPVLLLFRSLRYPFVEGLDYLTTSMASFFTFPITRFVSWYCS